MTDQELDGIRQRHADTYGYHDTTHDQPDRVIEKMSDDLGKCLDEIERLRAEIIRLNKGEQS